MDRLLIDYLPPFMQEYKQMQEIMNSEQPEFDLAWETCDRTMLDLFIVSATETGIARWEKMLGITPKIADTLEERRFRILARINQELPYTMRKLEENLTLLVGKGNYVIDLQADKYHIEIKLALGNKNNYQEVVEVLKKMIPANLTQWVQIMWNTHKVLSPYPHKDLKQYTQIQLRNEVLN